MRIATLFLFFATGIGQAALFQWPGAVSNAGPYTLVTLSQNQLVFTPNANFAVENDPTTHKYNHHTRIAAFSDPVRPFPLTIVIAHSSGCTNEGDPGQQVAIEISTNWGMSWTPPIQVVPSQSAWFSTTNQQPPIRICQPRNFQVYNNNLYLVSGCDAYATNIGGSGGVYGAALIGQQISCTGLVGNIFRVSSTNFPTMDGKPAVNYDPVLGPPLMAYSKIYGCWGGSSPWITPQSEWTGWVLSTLTGWEVGELNTVPKDNSGNNFLRIWRSLPEKFVAESSSTDGGNTFTAEVTNQVPNNPSETMLLVTTNFSNYILIGNTLNYNNGFNNTRDPLYLAMSGMDENVTNVQAIMQGLSGVPIYAGQFKNGGAAYPGAVQVGNYLYVSYSIAKEQIGFSRVLIPGLQNNNNDGFPFLELSGNSTLRGSSTLY